MKISKLLTFVVGLSLSQHAFALRLASPSSMRINLAYKSCMKSAVFNPMKRALCAAQKSKALSALSGQSSPVSDVTTSSSSSPGMAVSAAYQACLSSAGSNIFKKIACKAKRAASLSNLASSTNGVATAAGQSVGACSFGDEKCLRVQRDLAFKLCVKKNGIFAVKKCQDQRNLAIKSSLSQQQHLQFQSLKALKSQQLGYQGKVTVNSAQASSGLPKMERMSNRSFSSSGPNMIGSRSMVSRAVDRSRDVARTATYRSSGRTRGRKVMAAQGRAFDPSSGYSAQHRKVMAKRAALEQANRFTGPRGFSATALRLKPRGVISSQSAFSSRIQRMDAPMRSIASVEESAPVMQRFPTSQRASAVIRQAPSFQRVDAEPIPMNTFYGR